MLTSGLRYYSEQQHLSALAVTQVRRATGLARSLQLLATYQASAALLAMESGTAALNEQHIGSSGAELVPSSFAVDPGSTSILEDIPTGYRFDRIVSSLVADAGRSAMGAFVASRTTEVGSVRQLTPPSCSRCAILAGRWYRWSEGFRRHPKCDCVMVPAGRGAATYNPQAAYDRGEITDLTAAQRTAIDSGADINRVVNTRSGMQTVNFAGTSSRVTPESIYRLAGRDRTTAVLLLKANGYIL